MIELIYTSNKTVDLPISSYGDWFTLYSNSPDAMIVYHNGWYLYKVFRDGTTCFIGRIVDCKPVALNEGRIGWYDDVPGRSTYRRFLMSDDFAFQPHMTEIINPDWLFPTSGYKTHMSYIDLNKRLWVGWNSIVPTTLYCINIDSGETVWTNSSVGLLGTGGSAIFYVSVDYIMTMALSPAEVFIININTGVVRNSFAHPGGKLFAYDFNHKLFITIADDQKIRVYLTDRYPASFGAVISEYGVLQAYRGCNIKVQLLSADSLPCPNRLVTWELPNSLGSLEKIVTETGEDGYAWNYYFGPTVAGGTEIIKVSWG